jgi:transcription antitermination factor NusG
MMDFWCGTNWYAIQAKPYREAMAASHLANLEAEVFLPRRKQEEMSPGSSRAATKPLFPGYFFARFCPASSLDAVRYAHGVLRVVGSRQFPLPVEDGIVLELQARVDPDGFIAFQPPSLQVGEKVTVEEGPFRGLVGTILREWDDGKRVMILLEAIQHAQVLIERRRLAAIEDEV